jgi:hypothetical protein
VLFLSSGTVNTVLNSVTSTITGTPDINVVLWKGTAVAGTQGTAIVNLVANQSTATIGTVLFLSSGTVNTVLNSVTSTVIGTPAVDVVLWKGTAAAGTQGTAFVNLVPNQSTATIGTVSFLASGTVNTVLNSVTATITGTPAVDAVKFLGTAIVGTQGTLTNIGTVGTAGTALGTVAATVSYLSSTRAELTAVPGSSVDIGTKIDFIYMTVLNGGTQGSGATATLRLMSNAATGSLGARTITDDGVIAVVTKWA